MIDQFGDLRAVPALDDNSKMTLAPTLSGAVFDKIQRAVISGELVPGQRIDQNALARDFGVSLVPIREALRKLEAQGLVMIIPRRGAYVSPISRDEMEDLYAVRLVLEGMATRHSVPRLKAGDLEALEAAINGMEVAMGEGDYHKLLELNRTFHSVIYRASGRQCLIDLISQLWEKSTRYRVAYIHLPDRARQAHEEHKEILRCLKGRSAAQSARAVRNNIRQTMLGVIAAFDRHSSFRVPPRSGLQPTERP